MADEATDVPGHVSVGRGKVREHKPDGTSVDFTPEAALETANRLTEAAVEAKGEESWRDEKVSETRPSSE